MIKKRIIAAFTGLAIAAMIVAPSPSSAITVAELQVQINALLAQLATLQAQLDGTDGGSSGGSGTFSCPGVTSFDRNLTNGSTGVDVKCLQMLLNSSTDTQLGSPGGAGSPGNETSYFGSITRSGVVKFQDKYAAEVLAPVGLTAGTGFFGPSTRSHANTMFGGLVVSPPPSGDGGDGGTTTPPVTTGPAGSLVVAVAGDTPSAATVPANATAAAYNVPAIKINFTAVGGPVTVTGLKILRSGISQDAAIDDIKIFDEMGNQIGNSQSIGSSHKANFNNISFMIPANTTKSITVKISLSKFTTYSGNVIAIGIESVDDVVSDATATSGSFALKGNHLTLTSSVTIGTATLSNGSLGTRNTNDLNINPSDTDIRFTQVKITAGSAEGLTVKQITAVKNGTIAIADLKNIRLVNDNTGETLATVNVLNSNGRAVFTNLNIVVIKGGNLELSVLADMNESGSGRTATFDLHDGTAYTIEVIGNTYGFGLTPTRSDFCASNGTCTAQTINQGYLTVQKSSKTPVTGNISIGANQIEIAAFDFTVYGESINVTSTKVVITPANSQDTAEGNSGTIDYTNITGYDDNGNVLFGPKDGTDGTANTAETLTLTDSYTLPVGTNVIHIKANISNNVEANETVTFGILINSITAKGATSGKTTYTTSSGSTVAPTTALTGNVQTIKGPKLTVITAGTPAAANVVANAQNHTFAYFDLDASESGEDVKVTQILTFDTTDGSTTSTDDEDIIFLELWGDPDTTDSVDEFILLQTSTSTAVQSTGSNATTTFTFKTPLRIKKGTITRLTLIADVVSGAATINHQFLLDSTGNVTSTGWSTNTAITEIYSGDGQAQTITSVGTLLVIASADTPAVAQFVAGSFDNTMMTYEMKATNEDIGITTLYVATGPTDANSRAAVDRVKVYWEGTQIGASAGYSLNADGRAIVTLASEELVVIKDEWGVLSIKVDFNDKTQITDNTTLEIGLGDDDGDDSVWTTQNGVAIAGSYKMTAVGVDSGSIIVATTIDSLGTNAGTIVASYNHKVYKGILVVSKNTSSPSGSVVAGDNSEVLRLDLHAINDTITINEMEFCVAGTATGVSGTGAFKIKSNDLGTTYATVTQSSFDAYWDTLLGASTYYPLDPLTGAGDIDACISIGDDPQTAVDIAGKTGKNIEPFTTTLKISADKIKTIRIIGDTTGAASTLILQLRLQTMASTTWNATTSGIEWENTAGNDIDEVITKNTPVSGGSLVY